MVAGFRQGGRGVPERIDPPRAEKWLIISDLLSGGLDDGVRTSRYGCFGWNFRRYPGSNRPVPDPPEGKKPQMRGLLPVCRGCATAE